MRIPAESSMSDKTSEGTERVPPLPDQRLADPKAAAKNERRAHQKAITQGLRKFYDSVAAEPVPDEFMDLLRKLDDPKKGPAE
jgi:hypothetical protein